MELFTPLFVQLCLTACFGVGIAGMATKCHSIDTGWHNVTSYVPDKNWHYLEVGTIEYHSGKRRSPTSDFAKMVHGKGRVLNWGHAAQSELPRLRPDSLWIRKGVLTEDHENDTRCSRDSAVMVDENSKMPNLGTIMTSSHHIEFRKDGSQITQGGR